MSSVFSNGGSGDFVLNPFQRFVRDSSTAWIAAPFVKKTDELVQAIKAGKSVRLLVGLNIITSPESLRAAYSAGCPIKYYTQGFHAKLYVFDDTALVGSSNLTDGGMKFNREATILIRDANQFDELKDLFEQLWDGARVLTKETLEVFASKHAHLSKIPNTRDDLLEASVGKWTPGMGGEIKSGESAFLESIRNQVNEYRVAFGEVRDTLQQNQLLRSEFVEFGSALETNRFLNWLKLTYAPGDEDWNVTPPRPQSERIEEIVRMGREWLSTKNTKVPNDYLEGIRIVKRVFSSKDSIDEASKGELSAALMGIFAFHDQLQFVKGGQAMMVPFFWSENDGDVERVKRTLKHLIFGTGEFAVRLYDVLSKPTYKLRHIGLNCAIELYGNVKSDDYPPINGRIAKALFFLGFAVRAA